MPTPFDLDALALEMKTAQDAARYLDTFTARFPGFEIVQSHFPAEPSRSWRNDHQ
jgi:hypothetical protein